MSAPATRRSSRLSLRASRSDGRQRDRRTHPPARARLRAPVPADLRTAAMSRGHSQFKTVLAAGVREELGYIVTSERPKPPMTPLDNAPRRVDPPSSPRRDSPGGKNSPRKRGAVSSDADYEAAYAERWPTFLAVFHEAYPSVRELRRRRRRKTTDDLSNARESTAEAVETRRV